MRRVFSLLQLIKSFQLKCTWVLISTLEEGVVILLRIWNLAYPNERIEKRKLLLLLQLLLLLLLLLLTAAVVVATATTAPITAAVVVVATAGAFVANYCWRCVYCYYNYYCCSVLYSAFSKFIYRLGNPCIFDPL